VSRVNGPELRRLRNARGMRQVDLAEAAGVSVDTVKGYEQSGNANPFHLDAVAGALGCRIEDLIDEPAVARDVLEGLVRIPQKPWSSDRSPAGALLRADHGIVPFHAREKELRSIASWCDEKRVIGVRAYAAAGGMGKTRLLVEACRRLEEAGWQAGFLQEPPNDAPDELYSRLVAKWERLFLVVDYAEHRAEELKGLLEAVYAVTDRVVRVVCLARMAGGWWTLLRDTPGDVGNLLRGPAAEKIALGALATTLDEREATYEKAALAFAKTLGQPPRVRPPQDLDARHFDRVLLIHMMALAATQGVQVQDEDGLLDYVLSRERRFWRERAALENLPELVGEALSQAMAVLTFSKGARDAGEAIARLRQTPSLKSQDDVTLARVARVLHETSSGEDLWIEPVAPDLLGEHLVQMESPDPAALDALLSAATIDPRPEEAQNEPPPQAGGKLMPVFVSYSHRDKKWLDRLQVHLRPLVRNSDIDLWDDTRIRPGADWKAEIDRALEGASVAVLLVSADFLASDFIQDEELPVLLKAADMRGTNIIPVILGHCLYAESPLSHFQAINTLNKPLDNLPRAGREKALKDLARAIAVRLPANGQER